MSLVFTMRTFSIVSIPCICREISFFPYFTCCNELASNKKEKEKYLCSSPNSPGEKESLFDLVRRVSCGEEEKKREKFFFCFIDKKGKRIDVNSCNSI